MITLSIEQVIRLHEKVVKHTGGLQGIRDEELLESALMSPFQTFDGVELYPSTVEKIARITYGLVSNHPFIDGNKRIGTYVMMVLLELNQIEADFDDHEIIYIGIGLAEGSIKYEQLQELISRKIQKQSNARHWLHEEEGTYYTRLENASPRSIYGR